MPKRDIVLRTRLRIRDRLEELGMTSRELARTVRVDAPNQKEADAWISGILHGRSALHMKYVDAVCDALRLSPADLLRRDEDVVRELTPSEMTLLRLYHEWPQEVQRHWLMVMHHFSMAKPEPELAAIMDRIRMHPPSLRRPVMAWLTRLLEEGIPVEHLRPGSTPPEPGADESGQAVGTAEDLLGPMRRSAKLRKQRAAQYRAAGQK